MAQIEMQTTATNTASKSRLPGRFVARFFVSSILSAAGLLSFALTGPIMCRIAAIDPAALKMELAKRQATNRRGKLGLHAVFVTVVCISI